MTSFYADFHCLHCNSTQKLLYEHKDKSDDLIMPGEPNTLEMTFKANCEFCGKLINTALITKNNYFLGFESDLPLIDAELESFKESTYKKWASEKNTPTDEELPFETQPFKIGFTFNYGDNTYKVLNVYRIEWVEKDLDVRINFPRPETYWYQLEDKNNNKNWLRVDDSGNAPYFNNTPVLIDNNDVLVKLDEPKKLSIDFFDDWFGGRKIKGYSYFNGYRLIVFNYKNQIELDIFEDTSEKAFEIVEENIELGIFKE